MKIIYLISLLLLYFTFMYVKKSDKKINLVISIVYTFCIIYFYDTLIAYVLSTLKIKNTLFMFSLVYILTSAITIFICWRKKKTVEKQKYYLNKAQLIGLIILIIVPFTIGFFKYNKFTEIDYGITDAAMHYKMSSEYADYQKLLDGTMGDPLTNFDRQMFGYYVPCAIFMKAMPLKRYVSYNIFNTCMLCMLIVSFYVTCLEIKEKDKNNILTIIIALLYGLAYPLSYILYGFGYSGPGILATTLILLTWKFIEKKESNSLYLLLALFNFGLFISYYLFVPPLFLAEGLFLIYKFVKGKISFKNLFKLGIITLIIPSIIGFFYLVHRGGVAATVGTVTDAYTIEGVTYKDLWGDFILLIPMIIYSLITEIKNKKFTVDTIFIILEIIYIIVSLYFTLQDKISTYYYYKVYYILWLISYIYVYKLINDNKNKLNFIINISFIIFVITISLFNVEQKMLEKNHRILTRPVGPELASIYKANVDIFSPSDTISKKEVEFILNSKEYYDKCDIDKNTRTLPYSESFLRKLWFYALTKNIPTIKYNKEVTNEVYINQFDYDEFVNDDTVKCALLTNIYLENHEEINEENYKILYQDDIGKLIKKK